MRDLLLELVRIIDPVVRSTSVPFASTTIGLADGKYNAQVQLDIYNRARFALFEVLRRKLTERQLVRLLAASTIRKTDFKFTKGQAERPEGYIQVVSINDYKGNQIFVKPSYLQSVVAEKRNPHYKESFGVAGSPAGGNRFIFEQSGLSTGHATAAPFFILDQSLLDTQTFGPEEINQTASKAPYFYSLSQDEWLENRDDYAIVYLGLPRYKLAEVTDGITVESFDDPLHKWIIEYGVRISLQQGLTDVMAYGGALVGETGRG